MRAFLFSSTSLTSPVMARISIALSAVLALAFSAAASPTPETRHATHGYAKLPFATKLTGASKHPGAGAAQRIVEADRARIARIRDDATTRASGASRAFVGKHVADVHTHGHRRAASVGVSNDAVSSPRLGDVPGSFAEHRDRCRTSPPSRSAARARTIFSSTLARATHGSVPASDTAHRRLAGFSKLSTAPAPCLATRYVRASSTF
jgi:hypothetical protein